MFELPSQSNISEVVINKDVVEGKIKPLLTYSKKNNQTSSSSVNNKESKIG
jgi:ATP-dependent Clp protease ATP-binding subunit ClpX